MRKLVYQPREEEGKQKTAGSDDHREKQRVFQSYNEYIVIQEKPEIIIHTDKLRRAQHIERSKGSNGIAGFQRVS